MHNTSNLSKALEYVRNLKAGNHGIFFYRSLPEKHEVLFSFLQAGLEKKKGAVYVAAQETSEQIRKHMKGFGLNVNVLERDGVLRIFNYDEWYIMDGEVNGARTIMLGQRVLGEAMEIGLKGLHACGEAACFFEQKKEKELLEFELLLKREFDFPLTLLCAYDVNHVKSLEDKLFFSLIKAHGPVVTSSFAREVNFETYFPPIVREALETVFGEQGEEIILRRLEENYSIKPFAKIGKDSGYFVEGLEKLIGSGAQAITKVIAGQMHSQMGIVCAPSRPRPRGDPNEQKTLNPFCERILKAFMDIAILAKMIKDSPLSGYDAILYFHSRFGFHVSPGSVYSSVYQMEREGLIESQRSSRKRVYTVTEKGREIVNEALNAMNEINSFFKMLLSG